jgi:hypothetical protein
VVGCVHFRQLLHLVLLLLTHLACLSTPGQVLAPDLLLLLLLLRFSDRCWCLTCWSGSFKHISHKCPCILPLLLHMLAWPGVGA